MQARNSESDERTKRGATRAALVAGALVVMLAIPAAAFAGKGSAGSTSSPWIALAAVDGGTSLAAAAQPKLGSSVKFATGYPTGTKNPWVSVMCYQDGALVYGEGGVPGHDLVLGGATSDWAATGGAASCRAELGDLYWRGGKQYYNYLAHTNFDAGS